MKLVVFAHTPPPHHGQSYMVQLMLEGFGGDARQRKNTTPHPLGVECYHVNARFSRSLEDVGEFQGTKIFLIFWFCLQAIWLRLRYGVQNFYYVPAPGKRVALYRDWLIMLLCRPFFKNMILHWHAAGMAKWLETANPITARTATYRLFRPVNLSIVLSGYNYADAEKLLSRHIRVVKNGIADPCPDFAESVLPRRNARFEARRKLLGGSSLEPAEMALAGGDPQIVRVLFLAHCMTEKGLFDALEGVVLANARLIQDNSPLRLTFAVAGEFVRPQEKEAFDRRVAQLVSDPTQQTRVDYLGFVHGPAKNQAFIQSDVFCFPTYYHAESFGLVLVEAMSFGLPIVTTRWRSVPEVMPPDYFGLVDIRAPEQIADTLMRLVAENSVELMRNNFSTRFTLERHLADLAAAIRSVETE